MQDLARPGVRFINCEPGTGSRALLDRILRQAGLRGAEIQGYQTVAGGHLLAAAAVARGVADCCIAASSAARAFGLDFVPLQAEQFDLAVRRESMELPSIKVLLDMIATKPFRKRLVVEAAIKRGDAAAAKRHLENADRETARIEKFLGR